MTKRPSPDEYEQTLARLLKDAPVEFQNNRDVKEKALIFLELGGEALARQYLETRQKPFPDKLNLFEKPPEDEAKEGAEDQAEENEDLD